MFWNDKRVLITGHSGFIGGWLSLWLESVHAKVTGYSREPPGTPSLFDVAGVGNGIVSLTEDVRDLDRLETAMSKARPQVVFHLAAQPLVRLSYEDPIETFATNVMGTANVLEAVRRSRDVRVVVVATSDKCYENREWIWGYRETEPLGGHDPYSASKGAAEIVTAAFRRSFFSADAERAGGPGPAVASVRAGNVIGGGDWGAARLVPDTVRAFAAGEPVLIRSPDAERPWQHVLDALQGYLTLAEQLWANPALAEAWNFGPSDEHSRPVAWVVNRIAGLWGSDAEWQTDTEPKPHEATLLRLDSSKARRRLDWRPRLDLETSLEWTVQWYRDYYADGDMRAVTLEQLARYSSMAVPAPSAAPTPAAAAQV